MGKGGTTAKISSLLVMCCPTEIAEREKEDDVGRRHRENYARVEAVPIGWPCRPRVVPDSAHARKP
jgi:hypothetical protein